MIYYYCICRRAVAEETDAILSTEIADDFGCVIRLLVGEELLTLLWVYIGISRTSSLLERLLRSVIFFKGKASSSLCSRLRRVVYCCIKVLLFGGLSPLSVWLVGETCEERCWWPSLGMKFCIWSFEMKSTVWLPSTTRFVFWDCWSSDKILLLGLERI